MQKKELIERKGCNNAREKVGEHSVKKQKYGRRIINGVE